MTCIQCDFYSFRASKRPCTESTPPLISITQSAKIPPEVHGGPVKTKRSQKNVIRKPLRPTADRPTYCQVVLLFAIQQYDPTLSLTTLNARGGYPSAGASAALAPLELTENVTAVPSQPHQLPSEVLISFQISPHKRDRRIKIFLTISTVLSRWQEVLEQTTTNRLMLGRAKILPQFKIPLRIFW